MRWGRAAVLIPILLALAMSCATDPRPEGIVERWLLSLDQGSAGRPDLYATDAVSEQVLPGWQGFDPGRLDRIDVGRAVQPEPGATPEGMRGEAIPFSITDIDDHTVSGFAWVSGDPKDPKVAAVQLGDVPAGSFPSQGGPSVTRIGPGIWAAAAGVAIVLTMGAVILVTLVRRGAAKDRPGP